MTEPLSSGGITDPRILRRRIDQLQGQRMAQQTMLSRKGTLRDECEAYLSNAPGVTSAIETLTREVLNNAINVVERILSAALQEILDQPIEFRAVPSIKNGKLSIDFHIEKGGQEEHILKGQGGSVANIVSVILRIYILRLMDAKVHRPFLILDEQDCWLRPDLVPRLFRIIRQLSQKFGFQVLVISHHDSLLLQNFADKIYEFSPDREGGVKVALRGVREPDASAFSGGSSADIHKGAKEPFPRQNNGMQELNFSQSQTNYIKS